MALPSSDDELLLLYNPRCSKSRATLALLEDRGVDFTVREYLTDPLSEAELETLSARLGKPVREFVRVKEKEFAASGCTSDSADADLVAAIAANPSLMERPILVRGDRAAIGRPPEDVLALL
jgi:arsenate reductase